MILGCLSKAGVRSIRLCEGRLNQATYKVVLEEKPCQSPGSKPCQSPDLNPIENLWNVIKKKMDGHKPSNKTGLLEFLRQERHNVPQLQCERLVKSIRRHIKAVTENQGYSSKH